MQTETQEGGNRCFPLGKIAADCTFSLMQQIVSCLVTDNNTKIILNHKTL